jgi:hypothetical protein
MRKRFLIPIVMMTMTTTMVSALEIEVGAIGGGGLSFGYGDFITTWGDAVAGYNLTDSTATGSSTVQLFPEWSAGVYGQVGILQGFSVRLEPRWAYLGFARLARNDAGTTFEQYGAELSCLLIPILARGSLPVGPGDITASVGPFVGFALGGVNAVEMYSNGASTTGTLGGQAFLGISGGAGYTLPLGPGFLSLEARADWAFTSILDPDTCGNLDAAGVTLMVGYGIKLEGLFE